jgi:hypothetical protein
LPGKEENDANSLSIPSMQGSRGILDMRFAGCVEPMKNARQAQIIDNTTTSPTKPAAIDGEGKRKKNHH